eukprot:CAMPEP_0194222942 /NCGR_PEP_ID=MMETSP0156-20130528/34048_1 /TAXON_ID=33649 /ORGANISM="Thalassionema nitzschioides, Strain L26-B" /LENGTH=112 /DNA_ID=CAMNT_0038953915 /DNA_START=91 /DNA_END=430 /DNA_ORIENTATION=-
MMRLYSSIDAVESSPCNNEPSMSQEELEKERQTVEKQMRRLDEKKTRWRLMMQKEKNQSIETSIHSHPSIPSVFILMAALAVSLGTQMAVSPKNVVPVVVEKIASFVDKNSQ